MDQLFNNNSIEADTYQKWEAFTGQLSALGSAVVALSGGVDSSLLAVAAYQTLSPKMLAVTVRSQVETGYLMDTAAALAAQFGFPHRFVYQDILEDPEFVENRPDRCYVCKKKDLKVINQIAEETGFNHVLLGSNVDDLGDYRPGLKAAAELNALSPMVDVGLTKREIRALARALGLPNWNFPSSPCLASRIPYGSPVTLEKLKQIAQGEDFLHARGFDVVRVRHNGASVKIEVRPDDIARLVQQREEITGFFKGLGFKYVTLDLEGFRSGSLNEVLEINGTPS